MEVKENQISKDLLLDTIPICEVIQRLMTKLEPMIDTIIDIMLKIELKGSRGLKWGLVKLVGKVVSRLKSKKEMKKITGLSPSGWRVAIDKLTEGLVAIKNSDKEPKKAQIAQKDFESSLLGLIDGLGKLHTFVWEGITIVADWGEISLEDERYMLMQRFQVNVSVLRLFLQEIQEELGLGIKKK